MAAVFNISSLIKVGCGAVLMGALAACGTIRARLDALPTKRVATLPADQGCDAAEQDEARLTGAYLRQSDAAGLTFVPVLVDGRNNRNGLANDLRLNDQSQIREIATTGQTTFEGSRGAAAKARPGFGPTDVLPNVYDVSYDTRDDGFSGPMVLGPGAILREIPSSGARLFNGRVALTLITQSDSGAATEVSAAGRFSMRAGYGSASGGFAAEGFDATLPFDRLQWSGLSLCGTRFVSSGQGVVTVQQEDGPLLTPFKEDRTSSAFTALFDAAQFAPTDRPGPPEAIGGVFVIQSDNGTLTGVFLSDQPVIIEEETDA